MRRIYEPALTAGWEWALPINESENLPILEAFGRPLEGSWTPIRMRLLKRDEHGKPWRDADMPWMGRHLLILKPRAASVLAERCLKAGELLPLECEDADLVAWNVTTIVDALDLEKSKVMRFPTGRVMSIKEHYFKPEVVEGLVAFRIPEVRTSIFIGPELVRQAEEAGLTGTQFKEVWPIN